MTNATFSRMDLAPWRATAAMDPKEGKRLASAERTIAAIAADEAKHTCGRTTTGANSCKKCLSRKATNALGSGYAPQAVTEKNVAELIAEYTGEAWAERAEESAAFERDLKRICTCGHRFTEHRSRDPKNIVDMSPWGSRGDCSGYGKGGYYSGNRCQCYKFHEAQMVTEAVRESVITEMPKKKVVTPIKAKKPAPKSSAPMSSAAKVAAFRARARAAKLCGTCGKRPPAADRKYCDDCLDAAAERVTRSRAS